MSAVPVLSLQYRPPECAYVLHILAGIFGIENGSLKRYGAQTFQRPLGNLTKRFTIECAGKIAKCVSWQHTASRRMYQVRHFILHPKMKYSKNNMKEMKHMTCYYYGDMPVGGWSSGSSGDGIRWWWWRWGLVKRR